MGRVCPRRALIVAAITVATVTNGLAESVGAGVEPTRGLGGGGGPPPDVSGFTERPRPSTNVAPGLSAAGSIVPHE